jgi:hypothetical protein
VVVVVLDTLFVAKTGLIKCAHVIIWPCRLIKMPLPHAAPARTQTRERFPRAMERFNTLGETGWGGGGGGGGGESGGGGSGRAVDGVEELGDGASGSVPPMPNRCKNKWDGIIAANSTTLPSALVKGDATMPTSMGFERSCNTTAPPSEPGNMCVSVNSRTGFFVVTFRIDEDGLLKDAVLVAYIILLITPVLSVLRKTAGETNPNGDETMSTKSPFSEPPREEAEEEEEEEDGGDADETVVVLVGRAIRCRPLLASRRSSSSWPAIRCSTARVEKGTPLFDRCW